MAPSVNGLVTVLAEYQRLATPGCHHFLPVTAAFQVCQLADVVDFDLPTFRTAQLAVLGQQPLQQLTPATPDHGW